MKHLKERLKELELPIGQIKKFSVFAHFQVILKL